MSNVAAFLLIGLASVQLSASSSDVLSRYRDVTLGESLAAVVERLHIVASDVKVLYDVPSLVQEATWRPQRFISGSTLTADPLAELVLTFHFGRLARIVAIYDRERTKGLTDEDLVELVSGVYGVALLGSTPQPSEKPVGSAPGRRTIGSWANNETGVSLWTEDYPRRVGLTTTSTASDLALQEVIANGLALAAKNAPQRELERLAAAAATVKDRDAQVRLENKAKFKP